MSRMSRTSIAKARHTRPEIADLGIADMEAIAGTAAGAVDVPVVAAVDAGVGMAAVVVVVDATAAATEEAGTKTDFLG